jgi:hypothetical protein
MTTASKAQVKAYLDAAMAIADAIRDLGSVPSGHLYAHVMGRMGLETYQAIIKVLVDGGLVRQDASHLLTWIGPAKQRSE